MQSGYFTQLREIEEEVGSFGSLAPPIATRTSGAWVCPLFCDRFLVWVRPHFSASRGPIHLIPSTVHIGYTCVLSFTGLRLGPEASYWPQ